MRSAYPSTATTSARWSRTKRPEPAKRPARPSPARCWKRRASRAVPTRRRTRPSWPALSGDELAALDTETLCDVALALLCTGQAHDPSLFVDELESRQVRGGGIAAVKPVSADDVIVADPDATAAAMTVFAVYKSRTDGTIYDNTLMYIYNTADETDASFADLDGKKSAVTTAKTLVALLCAGVSIGGSLCANIKTTLDTFRYEPAGYFAGMRAHQGGAHSEEATAECFLAFAFSVYGPTWVKLAE